MSLKIQCVTIDAHDPRRVAAFWADALSWRITYDSADEVAIEPQEGASTAGQPDILFVNVPDDKVLKNRLHFDLLPEDQAAEVTRLEAIGARRVDIGQGEVSWVVMADPDGNEFCVLRPRPPEEDAGE